MGDIAIIRFIDSKENADLTGEDLERPVVRIRYCGESIGILRALAETHNLMHDNGHGERASLAAAHLLHYYSTKCTVSIENGPDLETLKSPEISQGDAGVIIVDISSNDWLVHGYNGYFEADYPDGVSMQDIKEVIKLPWEKSEQKIATSIYGGK